MSCAPKSGARDVYKVTLDRVPRQQRGARGARFVRRPETSTTLNRFPACSGNITKALQQPDVRERIVADGSEPVGSSPAEFRNFMAADLTKWARVVKESGAKLE